MEQFPEARKHLVTLQRYDSVVPLTKLVVFTEHKSDVRRRGVASTIKLSPVESSRCCHPLLFFTSPSFSPLPLFAFTFLSLIWLFTFPFYILPRVVSPYFKG